MANWPTVFTQECPTIPALLRGHRHRDHAQCKAQWGAEEGSWARSSPARSGRGTLFAYLPDTFPRCLIAGSQFVNGRFSGSECLDDQRILGAKGGCRQCLTDGVPVDRGNNRATAATKEANWQTAYRGFFQQREAFCYDAGPTGVAGAALDCVALYSSTNKWAFVGCKTSGLTGIRRVTLLTNSRT